MVQMTLKLVTQDSTYDMCRLQEFSLTWQVKIFSCVCNEMSPKVQGHIQTARVLAKGHICARQEGQRPSGRPVMVRESPRQGGRGRGGEYLVNFHKDIKRNMLFAKLNHNRLW